MRFVCEHGGTFVTLVPDRLFQFRILLYRLFQFRILLDRPFRSRIPGRSIRFRLPGLRSHGTFEKPVHAPVQQLSFMGRAQVLIARFRFQEHHGTVTTFKTFVDGAFGTVAIRPHAVADIDPTHFFD